jgi:hypothetical protein
MQFLDSFRKNKNCADEKNYINRCQVIYLRLIKEAERSENKDLYVVQEIELNSVGNNK